MTTDARTTQPARGKAGGDRGSVSVLACFIVMIAAALTVFLVDVGARLQVASSADGYAAEGARAAAIGVGPYPTPGTAETVSAAAAARRFLTSAGVTDFQVTVTGPAAVTVSVTITEQSPILGVAVSATCAHTAQLQVGVTTGQAVGG